jgi:hypothetical protein
MGLMQIRYMCSGLYYLRPHPLTPARHTKNHVTSNGGCLVFLIVFVIYLGAFSYILHAYMYM